jgi:hypothetical protein
MVSGILSTAPTEEASPQELGAASLRNNVTRGCQYCGFRRFNSWRAIKGGSSPQKLAMGSASGCPVCPRLCESIGQLDVAMGIRSTASEKLTAVQLNFCNISANEHPIQLIYSGSLNKQTWELVVPLETFYDMDVLGKHPPGVVPLPELILW